MKQAAEGTRFAAIDVLRGVAVLAVMMDHLGFAPPGGVETLPLSTRMVFLVLAYGFLGVDLFIVISGFCIHLPAVRSGNPTAVDFWPFWRRRQVRLYPPYLAAVLLSVGGLLAVQHGALGFGAADLALYGASFLFLFQNFTWAGAKIGNGPLWTLALEEQLYLLYFGLLWMRRRLAWGRVLAIVVAAVLVTRVTGFAARYFALPGRAVLEMLPTAYWLHWVLGAACVEAHLTRQAVPAWSRRLPIAAACFALGGLLLLPHELAAQTPELKLHVSTPLFDALDFCIGRPLFAVGAFVLLNCALAANLGEGPGAVTRALRWVGTRSYSLYLTHQPAYGLAKVVGLRLGLPAVGVYALRLATALAVGYAFYRILERYFHERARALGSRSTAGQVKLAPVVQGER